MGLDIGYALGFQVKYDVNVAALEGLGPNCGLVEIQDDELIQVRLALLPVVVVPHHRRALPRQVLLKQEGPSAEGLQGQPLDIHVGGDDPHLR